VTAIDYGAWDDLRICLAKAPIEATELEGLRDIWLAPLDRRRPPAAHAEHQAAWFDAYEAQLQRSYGYYRRWAKQMLRKRFADVVWAREDIPVERHLAFRHLQDAVYLAAAEAHGGRLGIALGLARESQRLGNDAEPIRIVAHDLEQLILVARGDAPDAELRWPSHVVGRTGLSPVGVWEGINHLLTFMSLIPDETFRWCVELTSRIAVRMASPRALLQADAWRVAVGFLQDSRTDGLDSVLLRARAASPGLRTLPELLNGCTAPRYSAFAEALDIARQSGNVWAQVTALAWMNALNPTAWAARFLYRLLELTGWRRLVLVPDEIAAEASLAMTSLGHRGRSVLQLALLAGRPAVTLEVAIRHVERDEMPLDVRQAALEVLRRMGTSNARDSLQRFARRKDKIGETARRLIARPSDNSLSEREVEVLQLAARGLTNREIGARLSLSEHTIARHIANARSKLGAANRAEAVSRLAELSKG
jgi:DNA-binding CsgD family transcriptional regulator